MASMALLEVIDSPQGTAAITDAVADTLAALKQDLTQGYLGGTSLAYDIAIVHVGGGTVREELSRGEMTCAPDPENGKYNYYEIASKKQAVSLRTFLSMRDAKNEGLLLDDDVTWIGNVVVCLDIEGQYLLIVSCSGLSDIADEAAAELMAANIKRKLLITQSQLLGA